MQGSVTDDGLPNPPATVTDTWSQVSGPGTATFTDASSPTTTVSFASAGTYVLRLTGGRQRAASDRTTSSVTVLPEGVDHAHGAHRGKCG